MLLETTSPSTIPQPASRLGLGQVSTSGLDYYGLPFAKAAFQARADAVSGALRSKSSVLDLGCNDGSFAAYLLKTGAARRVVGVDIVAPDRPIPEGMSFHRRDLRGIELKELGHFDAILILNVLHHLVHLSRRTAASLAKQAMDSGADVFVEMGSLTERGPWPWRRAMESFWQTDAEMWDDLFGSRDFEEILRYPGMGGGTRTLLHFARQ